jgi:hypothetical protein
VDGNPKERIRELERKWRERVEIIREQLREERSIIIRPTPTGDTDNRG